MQSTYIFTFSKGGSSFINNHDYISGSLENESSLTLKLTSTYLLSVLNSKISTFTGFDQSFTLESIFLFPVWDMWSFPGRVPIIEKKSVGTALKNLFGAFC